MTDSRTARDEPLTGSPEPKQCNEPCPVERGMRILGGKWKASILWHLQAGPMRFNALSRELGGASKKMIAERLKEMEETGLVSRQVIATKPVAVTYELTPFGHSALGILESLHDWCVDHDV
ncbi:winged helix-turn-helix transcriptional regulator [Methyloceanibacter stevinii]|uniref:winged helix-turn-helix transcriptional regulator n=1 Tax=Methyloceanibacter stevinii TaxID=1774970 RepID=UPI0019D3B496|nr:helix-turn-helix domain-containing protein [Methyloceanibacter stevinii]